MKNQKKQKINNFVFKYLKQKIKALQAVQNSNVNYTHVETPKVHNDNNHKQFKSQEAKQARPTVHTHIHSHAHTSTQAPTHTCSTPFIRLQLTLTRLRMTTGEP